MWNEIAAISVAISTLLVAPYCAIPRDYLSDTPLLRAMGLLASQHGQLGAIPPPPFLSVSPLESMRSAGAIPRPQKGYLSDTCAIPHENKANGCDTPIRDTISKRYCAIWGVSRTGPLSLRYFSTELEAIRLRFADRSAISNCAMSLQFEIVSNAILRFGHQSSWFSSSPWFA